MALSLKFENKSKRRITINDLTKGNIFIYENTLYMLLSNTGENGYFYVEKDDNCCGKEECDYFAIDLSRGILRDFHGSEVISLIEKDLEIKVDKEDISEWM